MRIRILGAFIALSLLASGCGGEAEIEGAAGTTDDVSALPVSDGTDVPAALDFLGDLAQTRGSRVTTTVDTKRNLWRSRKAHRSLSLREHSPGQRA